MKYDENQQILYIEGIQTAADVDRLRGYQPKRIVRLPGFVQFALESYLADVLQPMIADGAVYEDATKCPYCGGDWGISNHTSANCMNWDWRWRP